jgi:nucleotide-binding universal stress UspA family protein
MLPITKILCPTDFSEPSYSGLSSGIELAGAFEAELTLLHVVPVLPPLPPDPSFAFEIPEYERALHDEAGRRLRDVIEQRIPKRIKAHGVVAHGDPANEIVMLAQQEEAGLIVIATHGLTGWRHLVFGSVAEKVVRLAACPVLTIRAPQP